MGMQRGRATRPEQMEALLRELWRRESERERAPGGLREGRVCVCVLDGGDDEGEVVVAVVAVEHEGGRSMMMGGGWRTERTRREERRRRRVGQVAEEETQTPASRLLLRLRL